MCDVVKSSLTRFIPPQPSTRFTKEGMRNMQIGQQGIRITTQACHSIRFNVIFDEVLLFHIIEWYRIERSKRMLWVGRKGILFIIQYYLRFLQLQLSRYIKNLIGYLVDCW